MNIGNMTRRVVVAFVAMAVLFLSGSARASVISDPTADFSITNGNPNGLWSYGQMAVGFTSFQLFPYGYAIGNGIGWYVDLSGGAPQVWKNLTTGTPYGVPPGWISLHPGPDTRPSVTRWTAPASIVGQVSIQGQFLAGDIGSMSVGIRLNNTGWLWQSTDSGAFNLTCSPSPGDTIDFDVYGGYSFGNTPLGATITYDVPEPASLSLLALGGLALLRRRK